MGPKKRRRNLKRPQSEEVAKKPKGPAESPEAAGPMEAQPSTSAGSSGSFVPFSGAGHRLGEGSGIRSLRAPSRRKSNVRPAASYLLFPEPKTKGPRISQGAQVRPTPPKHTRTHTHTSDHPESLTGVLSHTHTPLSHTQDVHFHGRS